MRSLDPLSVTKNWRSKQISKDEYSADTGTCAKRTFGVTSIAEIVLFAIGATEYVITHRMKREYK